MKKNILFILFTCFIVGSTFARTTEKKGTITGKVIASDTKEIIDFANVLLFVDEAKLPTMQTMPN